MASQGSPRWVVALVIVAGLAIIGGGWWHADRRMAQAREAATTQARVQAIIDEFQEGLPRAYAPGLDLQSIAFEGNALVMTITSTRRRANTDDPQLAGVAEAEKTLLLQLCEQPDVIFLLARGVVITRRFVDRDGNRFFEISLDSADCSR